MGHISPPMPHHAPSPGHPNPHPSQAFQRPNNSHPQNYPNMPPAPYARPEMAQGNYGYESRNPIGYEDPYYTRDMGIQPGPQNPNYQFNAPVPRNPQQAPPRPPMPAFNGVPGRPQMPNPQQGTRQSLPPPNYGQPPRPDMPGYAPGHMNNPNTNYARKFDGMHESMPGRDQRENVGYNVPPPMNHSSPPQHQDFAAPPHPPQGQSMYRGPDPYAAQGQRGFPPGPGGMRPPMPGNGQVRVGQSQENRFFVNNEPDGYYESHHRISMQGGGMGNANMGGY